jgi:hypothetical protein
MASHAFGSTSTRTETAPKGRGVNLERFTAYLAGFIDSTVSRVMVDKARSCLPVTGSRAEVCQVMQNVCSLSLEWLAAVFTNTVNHAGEICGRIGSHGEPPTQVFCAMASAASTARGLLVCSIIARGCLYV